jgi:agmatinase
VILRRPDPSSFDPNGAGDPDAGIFGLSFDLHESTIALIGVPWEVTTSYGRGTARGPRAILDASPQLDLLDPELLALGLGRPWRYGIHMLPIDPAIEAENAEMSRLSAPILECGGKIEGNADLKRNLITINESSRRLNATIQAGVEALIRAGHLVGIVGGDHSVPFGSIAAHAEAYPNLGILHIDAHADLRRAYEGFIYSHASIMDNVLREVPGVAKIVQVAIRDYCEEENETIERNPRVETYFDHMLASRLHSGENWTSICEQIVARLPIDVYVSFDIDGLDPQLCPHTGTPVPGGLLFNQAVALIRSLIASGRRIVGFDLNEVAPGPEGNEWDANVGARMLYKLCGFALHSWGARDNAT